MHGPDDAGRNLDLKRKNIMSDFDRYGATPQQRPPAWDNEYERPKTSGFAIASLIFSPLIICPVVSQLMGIVLGVIGLLSVATSNGRKKGAGLAVAGIVISLISAGITVWGTGRIYAWIDEQFMRPPSEFMTAVENDDFATARTYLSSTSQALATDAAFAEFSAALDTRYGSFTSWQPMNTTGMTSVQSTGAEAPFPGTMTFVDDSGQAAVVDVTVLYVEAGTRWELDIASITFIDAGGNAMVFPPGAPTPASMYGPRFPSNGVPPGGLGEGDGTEAGGEPAPTPAPEPAPAPTPGEGG